MNERADDPGTALLRIKLQRDDSGYPPYESEQVLARAVEDHIFRLETIPVFAFGLALEDLVRTRHYGNPQTLWVEELHRPGGHSTIRVVVLGDTPAAAPRKLIEELGGKVENSPIEGLMAVDVPPDVDFRKIEEGLIEGQEVGRWDYNIGVLAEGHHSVSL